MKQQLQPWQVEVGFGEGSEGREGVIAKPWMLWGRQRRRQPEWQWTRAGVFEGASRPERGQVPSIDYPLEMPRS